MEREVLKVRASKGGEGEELDKGDKLQEIKKQHSRGRPFQVT